MSRFRTVRTVAAAGGYYTLISLIAIPFALPFIWMIVTSFTPASLIYRPGFALSRPTFENFSGAWRMIEFPRYILNSTSIAALATVGTILSSGMAGYAFATLHARFERILLVVMLASAMVPATITMIPLFGLFSRLRWIDTLLPLVVPHYFANAFFAFLFRQFFRSVPRELIAAAEGDGCNPWQTLMLIGFPVCRPVIAAIAVFSVVAGGTSSSNRSSTCKVHKTSR